MKNQKIFYWITTGLLALFIIPGIFFLNSEMAIEGTRHLGLPMWFHWELGIAKFLGMIAILLPMMPKRIKEWAYFGIGLDVVSAFIAHLAVDGAVPISFFPIIVLALLIVSYLYNPQMK